VTGRTGAPNVNRAPAAGRIDYTPQGWVEDAACAQTDTEAFFHPEGSKGLARARHEAEAKKVCRACPVRAECLEYALAHDERYGVWGGTGEDERAHLLAARRAERNRTGAAS